MATMNVKDAAGSTVAVEKPTAWTPLCQDSCRLNRFGTFGGADSSKWLDTDKRIRIG